MNRNRFFAAAAVVGAMCFATSVSHAVIVDVSLKGSVEWNFITGAPLNGAHVNDAAEVVFSIDSDNFSNNPQFPTRGYPIIQNSFNLKFPSFEIGLLNPSPAGTTPYFVVRNNDPAVDGF